MVFVQTVAAAAANSHLYLTFEQNLILLFSRISQPEKRCPTSIGKNEWFLLKVPDTLVPNHTRLCPTTPDVDYFALSNLFLWSWTAAVGCARANTHTNATESSLLRPCVLSSWDSPLPPAPSGSGSWPGRGRSLLKSRFSKNQLFLRKTFKPRKI